MHEIHALGPWQSTHLTKWNHPSQLGIGTMKDKAAPAWIVVHSWIDHAGQKFAFEQEVMSSKPSCLQARKGDFRAPSKAQPF